MTKIPSDSWPHDPDRLDSMGIGYFYRLYCESDCDFASWLGPLVWFSCITGSLNIFVVHQTFILAKRSSLTLLAKKKKACNNHIVASMSSWKTFLFKFWCKEIICWNIEDGKIAVWVIKDWTMIRWRNLHLQNTKAD